MCSIILNIFMYSNYNTNINGFIFKLHFHILFSYYFFNNLLINYNYNKNALYFFPYQGEKGSKGERGLTTTLKGDQFPTGIIEGPPGPPGPPGNLFFVVIKDHLSVVNLHLKFNSLKIQAF